MRKGGGPALLALGVFTLALWAQSDALVGVFFDDGVYAVLAKALAEGEGYRNIHLPGSPPGVHYPPLYPALLSIVWRIWPTFPENVVLFRVVDSAALGAAAWLMARHLDQAGLRPALHYPALALGFSAFPVLTLVGVTFSEPLFLCLVAGAILLADRTGPSRGVGAAIGVLLGLAILTRTIGAPVALGVAASLLFMRAWRPSRLIPLLSAAAALLVPWLLWVATQRNALDPRIASNYGSYFAEASQAGAGGFLAGLDLRVFGPLARLLLPAVPVWGSVVGGALLGGAVVWGGWVLRKKVPALVLSLAAYLAAVTVWPFSPDRFVWAVLPWLMVLAAAGLVDVGRRSRAGLLFSAALGLAVLGSYLPRELASLERRGFEASAEGIARLFDLVLPSIRMELPEDAVIATDDEALVYLYTGRRTVPRVIFRWEGRGTVPFSKADARSFHCEWGATHVLRTRSDPGGTDRGAEAENDSGTLFRIRGGPSLAEIRCP